MDVNLKFGKYFRGYLQAIINGHVEGPLNLALQRYKALSCGITSSLASSRSGSHLYELHFYMFFKQELTSTVSHF